MKFVVQRRSSDSQCVLGELLIDGQHECWTLEPPYAPMSVKPRAIPAGTYSLTVRWSDAHGRLLPHVEDVPGFEDIEIHGGNFPKDTKGCTLVGTTQSYRNIQTAEDFIGHSQEAFAVLFQKIQSAVVEDLQFISYLDIPQPADTNGEISV